MSGDWDNYTDESIFSVELPKPAYVWDVLIELKDHIIKCLDETGQEVDEPGMDRFNQPGWVNRVWSSENYRRGHVDVVDAREKKGLWMMHVCVFPHLNADAPIYGFDVICGKNKMTGAFLDYSPTQSSSHYMMDQFARFVDALEWKRERELPPWAKQIFSDNMMAAGNVNTPKEISQVVDVAKLSLEHYLSNVGLYKNTCSVNAGTIAQNRYAFYQKQNPHTPRVMKSLGLDEEDVDLFIQKCLFPDISS